MRNTKLLAFLLVIAVGILSVSCKKNAECKTCKGTPPDYTKPVTFKIGGYAEQLRDVQIWNKDLGTPFEFADYRAEDAVYDKIETGLNGLSGINKNSVLTVLYLNSKVSQSGDIDEASVKGISMFYPDGNMLQHELYLRIGNTFVRDNYLSVHSNCISMGAIYEINGKIANTQNSTVFIIDRKKGFDFKVTGKVDVLRKIALNYTAIKNHFEPLTREQTQTSTEAQIFQYVTKIAPEPRNCGGDCPVQSNSFCSRDLANMYPVSYICYKESTGPGTGGGGVCRSQANREQLLSSNAMSSDSVYTAHNDPLHYSFRDLLNRSEFGQKYIAYYYYFSGVYQSNVNLIVALKTASVLFSFNSQLAKLLNPAEYGNQVFLTGETKNRIISLINDYKQIYTDAYNNVFLNDIINDLNTYEGKTVNYIHTLF